MRSRAPKDVFDEIRVNERGEITEGTFTNVAILLDGKMYTPPVSCGLLPGTFRQLLLDLNPGQRLLEEKVLYPQDLRTAEKIFCMNSVRGIFEVALEEKSEEKPEN